MIRHWGKVDTGLLITAIILVAAIGYFFELTASMTVSAIAFPSGLIILMGIMEYAVHELRRK
ncbi:hypothetical protein C5Z25_08115 [Lactobacillus sp. CBA3605]|uniref:hypothetical protein n=1 Tax=Lactobacillus sp. CBA3605 TaxID=2099788 RepID=UPI000CFC7F43|nr:hypothetical protein [Lactobacillus sp. CBA3605]AVK61745.1 hypothetical protein C5Z25_08115 [Lactobacillus sp. CBA3605]